MHGNQCSDAYFYLQWIGCSLLEIFVFIYNAFFCKSFTKISATAQINFFIYRIKLYPKVWDKYFKLWDEYFKVWDIRPKL